MRRLLLAGWMLAASLSGFADKPDFSGTWKLNLERCEYAGQNAPKSIEQKIAQKDEVLKVDWREVSPLDQEVKYALQYSLNGKEGTNTMMGTPVKATAKWEGDVLSIKSVASFGSSSVQLDDRWRLAEGGTTLIVNRHVEGNAGKFDQTIVFDKQ